MVSAVLIAEYCGGRSSRHAADTADTPSIIGRGQRTQNQPYKDRQYHSFDNDSQ
jgi:hypothetical protein